MECKVVFDDALFDAKYIKGDDDQCWLWNGNCDKKTGYGQLYIKINNFETKRGAHRVALWRKLGYDNEFLFSKLHAGHTCTNRACVNPNHLVPQTAKENIDYKNITNTQNKGSTHGNSKLSESQVLEIRSIKGKSQRQIAKDYGVSFSLISLIILRKLWQHI